jgi:hypothetical protein
MVGTCKRLRYVYESLFFVEKIMETLPIDELNNLKAYLDLTFEKGEITLSEVLDDVLDVLVLGWANGLEYASSVLGSTYLDYSDLQKALDLKIEDKTYKDRVREHFEDLDVDGIIRVADTESHRLYNEAVFESAKASGKNVYKTWETMMDDRVRETHSYIEGVSVPIDERFYTSDGDSALYPGNFELAQNNVNCRCYLTLQVN